ncbi:DUF1501 domain-containing protein [Chelatococcus sambhunathii]|uniref:DUF1501 domain-containing protein n=1 Tax=Chelatococcus sambhunathii TaxID=363953 RepID=A0ABU1DBG7_9HYPH|nr:DUF1501 domain-containing protein [Chelatococcus sambhunathii]MDR4305457.1 DUF1501 domain-containing protein [Chelatococcus sambhunathii]
MGRIIPPDEIPPALRAAALQGCEESRLLMSRRSMLGITAGLFSAAFTPRLASAAGGPDPRLLVVVLRGGMDGVNAVVPHGDPAYVSQRGDIAIPKTATQALDGFFGLNPALSAFGRMYRAKQAAAVHAVCTPLRNRSHFECQDNLESGLPDLASNPTGWLNRLLQVLPGGSPIRSHGAIQIGEAPLLLRGPAPVLGWSPTWFSHPPESITSSVSRLLKMRDPELYKALSAGLKSDELAERAGAGEDDVSGLRKAFRGAARLLSANDGPRIAVLSVGNFDTHSDQGTTDGFLWGSLNELDLGLAEFQASGPAIWDDTVIVMATEFGRTVKVNGDDGTDHGSGTVALLAGGAVAGGKVHGDWPGLAAKNLDDDALMPTTDLRAVFKGVLLDHLGVAPKLLDEKIFPQSKAVKPLRGLVRSGAGDALADASAGDAPVAMRPLSPIERYRRLNAS